MYGMARMIYDANRKMPEKGITAFDELKKNYAKGIELKGKTLGIVGFGRIGQALASIGLGNGMRILAFDPIVQEAQIQLEIFGHDTIKVRIATVPIEKVISESDFISFHVPGGKLITKNEIVKMKKGVMLVNAARGGVIDENDLIDGLNEGNIAYAALDVFENEPKPSQNILSHPKISLSPHIGASTNEAQERIGLELAEKVIAALS
jgi:D-3-phosphoglycerate dehydrogenase